MGGQADPPGADDVRARGRRHGGGGGRRGAPSRAGAFVAAETHVSCGRCPTCRTGRAHICENLRILGVDIDGAFAEYVVSRRRTRGSSGEGIDPDVASIMEPFGNAVHAAFGTGGGEDIATNAVAVIGCGPIGCSPSAIARSLGAWKVIAIEPNEFRRAMAAEMGADVVLDPVGDRPGGGGAWSDERDRAPRWCSR